MVDLLQCWLKGLYFVRPSGSTPRVKIHSRKVWRHRQAGEGLQTLGSGLIDQYLACSARLRLLQKGGEAVGLAEEDILGV
ncbi:hypothetical protein D3C86_2102040 [compost metagenome]